MLKFNPFFKKQSVEQKDQEIAKLNALVEKWKQQYQTYQSNLGHWDKRLQTDLDAATKVLKK